MKRSCFNIDEITKDIPSIEEADRKSELYELKKRLGLIEGFDKENCISKELIKEAGFKDLVDYDLTKLDVLRMIDNNDDIPERLIEKLEKAHNYAQNQFDYGKEANEYYDRLKKHS